MDKIVKIYKTLCCQTQTLTAAKYLQNNGGFLINTNWSQRNLETGKNVKFLRVHVTSKSLEQVHETLPVDISNELLSAVSASEKFKAILRESNGGSGSKENRKQYLEIWTNNSLSHAVDLTALNVHGDVYADTEFKSFVWSPDETKILYIAEKKLPNQEAFYKRKPEKSDCDNASPPTKGEEYAFRQDWGEQLVGKYASVIAIYDLQNDSVRILDGIPDKLCPGQVVWSPCGTYLVGVALETEPRKLGLIYCTNRTGVIFKLDLSGNFMKLSEENRSVSCPRFTPDSKYLIWLERNSGGPHHGGMKLIRLEIERESRKPIVVIDLIERETITTNNQKFYGLYNTSFPERCWANDNRRLIVSTPQKFTVKTYVINIETASVIELICDSGSQIALDVRNDILLLARKNYLHPDKLIIAHLPKQGGEGDGIEWKELIQTPNIELLNHAKYEYLEFQQNNEDEIRNFTGVYFGPKSGCETDVPLIVWPHGGPHSAFFNTFALEPAILVTLGFAILFVNYRGSIGAGEASLNYLLGRIGVSDVDDCVLATKECCKKYSWINPNLMALVGGSHGGFLVHHLSGQYPDMFKAVVSRNPVTDVASMSIISDIPDWCAVEAGSDYTQKSEVDNKLFMSMRKCSPIQHIHKIKAPTYLFLGSKDLRVPCAQGLELFYRLKANGVPVKVNMYDDNHTLSSVLNEMDHIINSALWLIKYVSNK